MSDKTNKLTSDSLHNMNCFRYIKQLVLPSSLYDKFPRDIRENIMSVFNDDSYHPDKPYADIYFQFLQYVEENIKSIYDNPKQVLKTYYNRFPDEDFQKQLLDLDNFIFSFYENDNKILEATFESIKNLTQSKTPSSTSLKNAISSLMQDDGVIINIKSKSPAERESLFGRAMDTASDDYKPQHTTSLPTIKFQQYNLNRPMKELRIGTQGQRHKGKVRISPLFERFLSIQAAREKKKSRITHIYFNNMGLDREGFEGKKEKNLTNALHQLEDRHANIAVITLPADSGLMSKNDYRKTDEKLDAHSVYEEFLLIASQDKKALRKIKDFKISDPVRRQLFADAKGHYTLAGEKEILARLLQESFKEAGIELDRKISMSQRQAVWFHFNKYKLTNYIIEQIIPDFINFSCKDAIDRGGVSSAYYNLLKSFDSPYPMDREAFDSALHAAPAMVKARGMNHHLQIIWNAINIYVNQNYDEINNSPEKAWVIQWRDCNCPSESVSALLKIRVAQNINELKALEQNAVNKEVIQSSLKILEEIQKQSSLEVSGKRLLLETAVLTPKLVLQPEEEILARYKILHQQLDLNCVFKVLGGLMKILIGLITSMLTFGYFTGLFKSGISTMKAGYDAKTRQTLRTEMKQQVDFIEKNASSKDEPLEEASCSKTMVN